MPSGGGSSSGSGGFGEVLLSSGVEMSATIWTPWHVTTPQVEWPTEVNGALDLLRRKFAGSDDTPIAFSDLIDETEISLPWYVRDITNSFWILHREFGPGKAVVWCDAAMQLIKLKAPVTGIVSGGYSAIWPAPFGSVGQSLRIASIAANEAQLEWYTPGGGGGGGDSFVTITAESGTSPVAIGVDSLGILGGNGIATVGDATAQTITISAIPGEIDHNSLLNYVAAQHTDRTAAAVISGLWAFTRSSAIAEEIILSNSGAGTLGLALDGALRFSQASFFGTLQGESLTAPRAWTLPNQNGVLTALGNSITGTGAFVLTSSPTIVTPTIASFANATHAHTSVGGGGTLDVAAIASGVFSVARGGTGVATIPDTAVVLGNGTGAVQSALPGAAGTYLRSAGVGSDPAFSTIQAGDIPSLAALYLRLTGGTLTGNVVLDNQSSLKFDELDSNGPFGVRIMADPDMSAAPSPGDYTLTLPRSDPASGEWVTVDLAGDDSKFVLAVTNSGRMTWVPLALSGSGGNLVTDGFPVGGSDPRASHQYRPYLIIPSIDRWQASPQSHDGSTGEIYPTTIPGVDGDGSNQLDLFYAVQQSAGFLLPQFGGTGRSVVNAGAILMGGTASTTVPAKPGVTSAANNNLPYTPMVQLLGTAVWDILRWDGGKWVVSPSTAINHNTLTGYLAEEHFSRLQAVTIEGLWAFVTNVGSDTQITFANSHASGKQNISLDGKFIFDQGARKANLVAPTIATTDKTWTFPDVTGEITVLGNSSTGTGNIVRASAPTIAGAVFSADIALLDQHRVTFWESVGGGSATVSISAPANLDATYSVSFPSAAPLDNTIRQYMADGTSTFIPTPVSGGVNAFGTITPNSGGNVVADTGGDTLTLVGTSGITFVGTPGTDTITASAVPSQINHNALQNYVLAEHFSRLLPVTIEGIWNFTPTTSPDVETAFSNAGTGKHHISVKGDYRIRQGSLLGSLQAATLATSDKVWTLPNLTGEVTVLGNSATGTGGLVRATLPTIAGANFSETSAVTNGKRIVFFEEAVNGGSSVTFGAPANLNATYTSTFPPDAPTAAVVQQFNADGSSKFVAGPPANPGTFSKELTIEAPGPMTRVIWEAEHACTVTAVRAIKGGAGSVSVQALKNATDLCTSDISPSGSWTGGTLAGSSTLAFAAGDSLAIEVTTGGESVDYVTVMVRFLKPAA